MAEHKNNKNGINDLLSRVLDKINLTKEESNILFSNMLDGDMSDIKIASVLTAFRSKGVTPEELYGVVNAVLARSNKVDIDGRNAIDIVGTGGDGKSSFNVSSATSILLWGLGYDVVKHGNKAQSGKVGSADVISKFGIDVDSVGQDIVKFFGNTRYAFLFAIHYHPALRLVAGIRRELGFRTMFNYIGPLANPVATKYGVYGVFNTDTIDVYFETAKLLGKANFSILSSTDGYDEVSTNAPTIVREYKSGVENRYIINPSDFFEPFEIPVAHDEEEGVKLFHDGLFYKNELASKTIALNGAVALKLMGKADSIKAGYEHCMDFLSTQKLVDKVIALR